MRKVTLQDAVDIFLDNRDIVPIYTIKNGDYAVQVQEMDHMFLVVETTGDGILIGRLPPDIIPRRLVEDDDERFKAWTFIDRRLKEAGLY